jgi:hypothetical protein
MKSGTTHALKTAHPHIAGVLDPVSELITQISQREAAQYCKLEARIGSVFIGTTGFPQFKSGINTNSTIIARILCRLETSDVWKEKTEWTQQVDRYYLLLSGLEVCTTTEVVRTSDGPRAVVTHRIKSNSGHVDLHWGEKQMPCDALNIRVQCKQSEPVFEDELQDRVDDLHIVRLKQRKTFTYVSSEGAVWKIHVTQIYQALHYIDVLNMLHDGDVSSFDVVVECCEPLTHLRINGNDPSLLAASLLLKVTELFEFTEEHVLYLNTELK